MPTCCCQREMIVVPSSLAKVAGRCIPWSLSKGHCHQCALIPCILEDCVHIAYIKGLIRSICTFHFYNHRSSDFSHTTIPYSIQNGKGTSLSHLGWQWLDCRNPLRHASEARTQGLFDNSANGKPRSCNRRAGAHSTNSRPQLCRCDRKAKCRLV